MRILLALMAASTLAACEFGLRNVVGSWSCPLVNGQCSDIADHDPGAGPIPADVANGLVLAPGSSGGGGVLPYREPDEVARIVLAPVIDGEGRYHGAREIFVVVRTGGWAVHGDAASEGAIQQ